MLPIRVDKSEPYDIFIGRPSKFSNPYRIGIDGTRSEIIKKFEKYFRTHPELESLIKELDGKRVACWCKIDQKCHGDIIISIIKENTKLLSLSKLFE